MHKDITFNFRLYSIYPDLTIPAVTEFGEDIEFVNSCITIPAMNVQSLIRSKYPELELDFDSSIDQFNIVSLVYTTKQNDSISINFVVDSNQWPQPDPNRFRRFKELADAGELCQRWWVNQVDIDGKVILHTDVLKYRESDIINNVVSRKIDAIIK